MGKKVVRTMDWRFSRAWSRYDQVGEWEETKVDQDCPKCGMWCPALREHQMHQCGEVRRRILQWQNQVADHVHIEGDKKYRIAYNWGGGGGGKVKNRDQVMHIVWCHPSQCAQVVDSASGTIDVWPVWLGLGPVSVTVRAMHTQGKQSPARLIYNVVTALATTTQAEKSQELCYTRR